MTIFRPALHIYYFAPKKFLLENQSFDQTAAFLKTIWSNCEQIAIKDKNSYLNLTTEFPTVSATDDYFHPLAAKTAAQLKKDSKKENDADRQTYFFEHEDYVGLIVTIEAESETASLSEWNEMKRKFGEFFPEPPEGNIAIECFYLYTGIYPKNVSIIQPKKPLQKARGIPNFSEFSPVGSVFQAMPLPAGASANKNAGQTDFLPAILPTGWYLWKRGETNKSVSLALLAAQTDDLDALEEDLWRYTGWEDDQIPVLVGYLLHLSKLNYAAKVFWSEYNQIKEERNEVDKILQSLFLLNENIIRYQINISGEELAQAESELLSAQAKSNHLLYSLSRVRELKQTIKIALSNMEEFIPLENGSLNQNHVDFLRRNKHKADKLIEQIEGFIEYLQASQERSTDSHHLARLFQEREAKKIAQRLNNLILWQGSLLGALGIGLAALQATGEKPPIASALFLPLSLFLGALALSLPALFAHWADGYRREDYFMGAALSAAFAFFSVSVLNTYFYLFTVSQLSLIVQYLITFAAGFTVGWIITRRVSEVIRKNRKSKFGIPLSDRELLSYAESSSAQKSLSGQNPLLSESNEKIMQLANAFERNGTILSKHDLLNHLHKNAPKTTGVSLRIDSIG